MAHWEGPQGLDDGTKQTQRVEAAASPSWLQHGSDSPKGTVGGSQGIGIFMS